MPPATPGVTKKDAAAALELLADQAEIRRQRLEAFPTQPIHLNEDDQNDSDSPIMDVFVETGGENAILKMTNFSRREFDRIWGYLENHISTNWNTGRGRKTAFGGKDVLFMLLTSLKHGGKWDYMRGLFRIKRSVFQRLMKSFLDVVSPFLYDTQVTDRAGRIPMRQLSSQGKQFKNHPHSLYATDVTF